MRKRWQVEYDPDVGAAYIRIQDRPVARTEELAPGLIVDLADDGTPVGLDLPDAAAWLGHHLEGVDFTTLAPKAKRKAG